MPISPGLWPPVLRVRGALERAGLGVAAFFEGDRVFGLRQMLGNNRERCVDDFLPYPGFVRDMCENQSEPWFGDTWHTQYLAQLLIRPVITPSNTPDRC